MSTESRPDHLAILEAECPRCHAQVGEPCSELPKGSHSGRVALWQAKRRSEHQPPPSEERERVRASLAKLRSEHGWSRPDA